MIKIAHRGNIEGPNSDIENEPAYLVNAIIRGYDVEADIRMTESGMYLGHDSLKYEINEDFINDIKDNTWFHCKNIEALGYFINHMPDAKFFWHQEDDYTLTSNGYIWTYPGKTITNKSIVVLQQKTDLSIFKDAYAVCSDYFE
jgi:hypothetical protein